ncbi:hypothetical protein M0R45_019640 [Rubus argutus]|uniref:Cytochrome P450 n=1 Tax=Rubus argutus TaxID=59490 RepID=A0AAW1X5X8_RUBAR
MVDSNSHSEIHSFSGNQWPFLQTHPWKQQRNQQHAKGSHEQTVLSAVQPHIHSWTKSYGKNFLQWHGLQPALIITEPELCKEILNDKDRVYTKSKPNFHSKKLFGDGIIVAEGEKWSKLRTLSNHAFHGDSLKSMIPDIIASSEWMLEGWKKHEGKEIEVHEQFRLRNNQKLLQFRIPGISKVYKSSDEKESEKLEKGIHDSIIKIVKKREKEVVSGEEDSYGSDFLGMLLKAHYGANEKHRISECKAFYIAGQETTNSLLIWTVFLLALHPDWQEEARKEVLKLFGKETPNPDGLAKLKTMSMIINASLRLYPPVIGVGRKVDMEVRLGNLIVPANVQLHISTLALHLEPQFWGQDVKLFKPERFSKHGLHVILNSL